MTFIWLIVTIIGILGVVVIAGEFILYLLAVIASAVTATFRAVVKFYKEKRWALAILVTTILAYFIIGITLSIILYNK